jgi:hypothetical protein
MRQEQTIERLSSLLKHANQTIKLSTKAQKAVAKN